MFDSLAPAQIEAIAAVSGLKKLNKGEYLFREGEPSKGFYVVQRGALSVHRVSAGGREQVLHVFQAGDSFAEATLASEGGYPADAVALTASSVVLVPRVEFLSLLRAHPELALRMLVSMSKHLRSLVALVDDLTFHDVETRLVRWLLKRCPEPPMARSVTVELAIPKRVLASLLSISSETLSRSFAKLRNAKLITMQGKTIRVLNPLALQKLLLQKSSER